MVDIFGIPLGQAVALTTKGPNVSVLTHAECSIGAPSLGDPH
jgi:hypothetical protein